MSDEHKDPSEMNAGEIAVKLWHVAKAEPLDLAALLIWCGVACAKLIDVQRASDGRDRIV